MIERIDLVQVWRDTRLLEEIRSEIKRKAGTGWRAWELLLPPELLWPMINEISESRLQQWSPMVDGIGVQVGQEHEIAIRFVLPNMKMSPVTVSAMPYKPWATDNIAPIEVHGGPSI